MKKLLTISLLLCSTIVLWAQNTITGRVLDASSRHALDYVNVSLTRASESAPVAGAITDQDGMFALTNVQNGDYVLAISFVGYKEAKKTLHLKGGNNDAGKFYLEENNETLQEVEVVGQSSTMRFELDKKIFTVDQSLAAAGGSVTDALEQVPSVDVDQEGNISLRNSEDVEIWINGHPAGLTAENRADILKQMPAGSIKEIEVMTNPGAKFSPEGTAGIINLVMKKDRKAGYYGSVNAAIDYTLSEPWDVPPGGRIGANFNFNKGIVEGYANLGYHYHSANGGTINDRYSYDAINPQDATQITRLKKDGENRHNGGGMFIRAGLDFHVTDRSTIGISGFGLITAKNDKTNGAFSNRSNNPTWYEEYDVTDYVGPRHSDNTEVLTDLYKRTQKGQGYHPGYNARINWQFDINSKHKLNMSAQFDEHTWNSDHFYHDTHYDVDSRKELPGTTVEEQLNENNNKKLQLKADYEWKPNEKSRLEAGWQTDLGWRNTSADAWESDEQHTRGAEKKDFYDNFQENEQTHALYLTYGNRFWDKFSVLVGLRAELFKRHIEANYYDALGSMQHFTQDTLYFQAYPSVYLSYAFPKNHELQLNYTRRIQRPRGHQINPRQDLSDPTNITYGNIFLLPQYSSSLELNYLKTWERHTISAGLFYRFAEDVRQNIKFRDGDIMRNTWANFGKRHEAGLEFVAKNKLFKELLQITTSLDFYYNRMDKSTYTPMLNGVPFDPITIKEQNIFVFSARINLNFLFTKTFSGQIAAKYNSPRVMAQGKTEHSYFIDLALRKTFLDGALALTFNVRDILDSRARRSTSEGDGFWQYQENRWHSRTISLGLTYNFGNMKPKKHEGKNIDSHAADDDFGGEGSDE